MIPNIADPNVPTRHRAILWLRHSDVALLPSENLVIIPGVGAYSPGIVAH